MLRARKTIVSSAKSSLAGSDRVGGRKKLSPDSVVSVAASFCSSSAFAKSRETSAIEPGSPAWMSHTEVHATSCELTANRACPRPCSTATPSGEKPRMDRPEVKSSISSSATPYSRRRVSPLLDRAASRFAWVISARAPSSADPFELAAIAASAASAISLNSSTGKPASKPRRSAPTARPIRSARMASSAVDWASSSNSESALRLAKPKAATSTSATSGTVSIKISLFLIVMISPGARSGRGSQHAWRRIRLE